MTAFPKPQFSRVDFVLAAATALIITAGLRSNVHARAHTPIEQEEISSTIVCTPDSTPSCLSGPATTILHLNEPTTISIDVYLVHTGEFEESEQAAFYSPLGDLTDCGPIPPGAVEIYCGTVSGQVSGDIPLMIQHNIPGSSTGTHQQRYEITLCKHKVFFPLIVH